MSHALMVEIRRALLIVIAALDKEIKGYQPPPKT